MGLDMYLSKKTCVKNWGDDAPNFKVEMLKNGQPMRGVDPARISYIVEEVGYWRKANAIHRWFVQNCQDGRDECQKTWVSREKLQTLLDLVRQVLADPQKAPDLLPTQGGFFFGSVDYDEWYMRELEHTEKTLSSALAAEGGNFYYQASW